MATWKKVAVSGSDVHLRSLSVGTVEVPDAFGAASPSNISSSTKIFANSSEGAATGDLSKVVIVNSAGSGVKEWLYTSSAALSSDVKLLSFGAGISGSLKKAPTGTGWSGSDAGTINIDTGSLSGDGLTGTTQNKITVLADPTAANIQSATGGVSVLKSKLVANNTGTGQANGLKVDGTTIALKLDDSTMGLNGDGKLTASISTVANSLEDGNGIIDFEYNGSSTATIAFDAGSLRGAGLTTDGTSHVLTINTGSGAAIDGNNIIKFNSSNQFSTMSITNDGSDAISIGTELYTSTIDGDLVVEGTATFATETSLEIKDQFIEINSGSGKALTDDFGFVGQTGSADNQAGMGWIYEGASGGGQWTMTRAALGSGAGAKGTKIGSANLFLATTDIGTVDVFDLKDGYMLKESNDLYIYAPAP